jgi:hypothetical protein
MSEQAAEAAAAHFAGVDSVFLALGVGAPSKLPRGEAGQTELMRVDCLVPTAFARAAKQAHVPHVSLLTAGMARFQVSRGTRVDQ